MRRHRLRTGLAAVTVVAGLLAAGLLPAVGGATPGRGNPFAATKLFVDPASDAARQAEAWARRRPAAAAQLRKIAVQPWAEWYGDWLPDPGALLRQRVATRYAPAGAAAFIGVYDLPHRDCSGTYSAGGAHGAAAYRAWIDNLASAVGDYPAIVVLEPDGLPDTVCLGSVLGRQRLSLLAYAVHRFARLGHTSVYIDAGRSDWRPAGEITAELRRADVREARGFALDVTGYAYTRDELRYGDRISRALGGAHFIVNTSRNGNGPIGHAANPRELWCNTPGRALGPRPTTRTGDPHADAFEWVLHPGYSDGPCEGGPPAGTWWPSYALGLATRARY